MIVAEIMIKYNVKGILRKIASLIILNIGLVILLSAIYEGLQLSYIISMSNNESSRLFSVLPVSELSFKALAAIIIILLGIYLWSWKKKLIITGILTCLAAFDFALTAVSELYAPTFKYWNPDSLCMRYIITAVILFAIGATLLILQKKRYAASRPH